MKQTIAGISTPLGKGAISIVRMSGINSLKIAQKFFHSPSKLAARVLRLGNFELESSVFERCLMVYFEAPYSYTGEDMVEFQIHGGVAITELVLQKLIENGAELAQPGEFSKRAFENGKISLSDAESIVEEINSESEGELKLALSSLAGKLQEKITSLQNNLTELLAQIEVSMDYPDEDENEDVRKEIFKNINEVQAELGSILTRSQEARFVKNGVNIAIVGQANVGKSSLLNALLNENKAIVTEVEGTTRDIVEGRLDYKGVRFNFFDTAGLRESENAIERMGIEKSKQLLEKADIVLFVQDANKTMSERDKKIQSQISKPHICVINKCDLPRTRAKQDKEIEVSAKNGTNIQKLKDMIYDQIIKSEIDFNSVLVTNERQLAHLKSAETKTKELLSKKCESLDVLAFMIKNIWNELGKITGQTENEDIISLIFSKFCVGK